MFDFTSRYPAVISIALLAISVSISIYFYRKSPLPNAKKYFLIILKSLAFFLLLVLFIEPSIITSVVSKRSVSNIILVDNSRSNELPSFDNKLKKEDIIQLLDKNDINKPGNKYFTFSAGASLISNKDSTGFNGYQTDLSSALSEIKDLFPDEQVSSLTVISDGNFNAGGNPLYKIPVFQCPVITVGVGDTIQKRDILVKSAAYNNKSFTGISNKIKAFTEAYNMQNESVNINLLREGTVVSTKTLDVRDNQWTGETEFDINESNPGIVHYTIRLDNKPGEITFKNNSNDFLIDYIDNKVNILFVSGGPGYDDALFTAILKRINNYNITIRTAKSPSEFYEGGIDYKIFPELSAVFLLNYPTAQSGNDIVTTLASNSKQFNTPLIFFAGKNTDYRKLDAFGEQVPFSVTGSGNEGGLNPQVISNQDNPFKDIASEISSAPQIFKNAGGITQKTGTEVMMTDRSSGIPVLINRNNEKNKATAFLGYGLWKWRANERTDYEKTVESLILKSINLTLQKEKRTKLKVYPAKDIFDYTEQPLIYAEVYDDNYQLTRSASVKGKIHTKNNTFSKDIQFVISENKYTAVIPPLPAGDYIIDAEAELNNNFYAKADSRFLSDTSNVEYLSTKSNFKALNELSQNSGGKFVRCKDVSDIPDLLKDVKPASELNEVSRSRSFNLWENKYVLLLIILFFSIEWIIRKRNNLA